MRCPVFLSIALTFSFALAAAPALAQTGGLALTGGLARLGYDGTALDTFDETFSEYYAARLDAPVDLLPGHVQGLSWGITGRVKADGVEFAAGYSRVRAASDARATFGNGEGVRVGTAVIDQYVFFEMLAAVLPRVTVGPTVRASLRENSIRAAWVYADGAESLGSEYWINGVYQRPGGSDFLFEAGGTVRLALTDRITLPVRVLFALPEPGGSSGIAMTDYDVQAFNDVFPLDFVRWAADPVALDTEAAVHPEHLRGMRLEAGVEVVLLRF